MEERRRKRPIQIARSLRDNDDCKSVCFWSTGLGMLPFVDARRLWNPLGWMMCRGDTLKRIRLFGSKRVGLIGRHCLLLYGYCVTKAKSFAVDHCTSVQDSVALVDSNQDCGIASDTPRSKHHRYGRKARQAVSQKSVGQSLDVLK